jgi:hypothetical protein
LYANAARYSKNSCRVAEITQICKFCRTPIFVSSRLQHNHSDFCYHMQQSALICVTIRKIEPYFALPYAKQCLSSCYRMQKNALLCATICKQCLILCHHMRKIALLCVTVCKRVPYVVLPYAKGCLTLCHHM